MKTTRYLTSGTLHILCRIFVFLPLIVVSYFLISTIIPRGHAVELSLVTNNLMVLIVMSLVSFTILSKSLKLNIIAIMVVIGYCAYLYMQRGSVFKHEGFILGLSLYYGVILLLSRLSYFLGVKINPST